MSDILTSGSIMIKTLLEEAELADMDGAQMTAEQLRKAASRIGDLENALQGLVLTIMETRGTPAHNALEVARKLLEIYHE